MTDIIVIGGGTAGLTAALYASRAGKSVTLFEKESTGGQIVYSPKVENYPGLPGISGADYAAALTRQAESFGVTIEYAEVLGVEQTEAGYVVRSDAGSVTGHALILAVGTSHRKLGLEKEDDLVGCGVSYCAVCDGAFYRDAHVAVLGGGSTALTDALFLSGICSRVTLIHRRDTFRGEDALVARLREKSNVEFLLSSTVTGLQDADGVLTGITVRKLSTGEEQLLPVEGLFIAIGQLPQTELYRGFVELDDAGYIQAGEDCLTSREGVFAAGDCRTKAVRQLTTASGDGAVAGLAACRYVESFADAGR
ncbi:MAG: FAD-dependent oxidoreductase [Clostridiales bacterium]|nr:FAD-dependent oxidoreductase [Clostridia bacterium]MCR4884752.1 FAD-dependent oxidoreductase [Clostridiales bacterium]